MARALQLLGCWSNCFICCDEPEPSDEGDPINPAGNPAATPAATPAGPSPDPNAPGPATPLLSFEPPNSYYHVQWEFASDSSSSSDLSPTMAYHGTAHGPAYGSTATASAVTAPPAPPTLFLYKNVTAFLRANLSNLIRAAVLTTPAGLLLAEASTLPASVLRRQCAVAASLWEMNASDATADAGETDGSSISSANNNNNNSSSSSSKGKGKTGGRWSGRDAATAPAVTVQLDNGSVFVIRRLACGMLFICTGGSDGQPASAATAAAGPSTAGAGSDTDVESAATTPAAQAGTAPSPFAPDDTESVHSVGTTGAATTASQASVGASSAAPAMSPADVLAMRRQVEVLARELDTQFQGLYVPEMGIGLGN
ncbi:hypothetical protein B0H67DRAFT_556678 [Lasiosphaeris hirsuta]|uniref:Uncharacterized protein n=1 Tax=Lasiosphaeris hirsuta TaxID=260670 RepID=A0AA40A2K9_9PEZI|nr:hypothetical protein B0H67DRAFT_556678 [Lasiosphaeris hirsuta]